jgi:hypothetical protein
MTIIIAVVVGDTDSFFFIYPHCLFLFGFLVAKNAMKSNEIFWISVSKCSEIETLCP